MSKYEIYVFIVCLIVFVAFVALFTALIVWISRLQIRGLRHGVEDEKLLAEYEKTKAKKKKKSIGVVGKIIPALFYAILFIVFLFSGYNAFTQKRVVGDIPMLKVVSSGSMASKHERNLYLFENDLNDQIQTFDLIVVRKLPGEFELELYDIVVYEVDDTLLVHRIVGIEEPNANHPEERHFLLQGDNVQRPDKFPVRYSQMRSIYEGERVGFIGSFVSFMQSPAGLLCLMALIGVCIASPIMDNRLEKEKEKRLQLLLSQSCQMSQMSQMAQMPQMSADELQNQQTSYPYGGIPVLVPGWWITPGVGQTDKPKDKENEEE